MNASKLSLYDRRSIGASLCLLLTLACLKGETASSPEEELGHYFSKKQYVPHPLPDFESLRAKLPSPIYDDQPLWVETYWKAWQLAFKNFHEPAPQSGFVSQFIDAAFNENIFLWDSCFMTMFCNYAHPLTPGISTLDNFYAKQHADGEICREIVRKTGLDFPPWVNREGKPLFSRWGWPIHSEPADRERNEPVTYLKRAVPTAPPRLTLDALNHPILAWTELESYQVTGDMERFKLVWEPLVRYYDALQKYLRQGNGLYLTDWASMDNSPRNYYLRGGGTGIDISSEMVLFARQLSQIARVLGKDGDAQGFVHDADELSQLINKAMWDPKSQFYFDLTVEGNHAPIKTVAAFWTLLARVASPSQARSLVEELQRSSSFGRKNPVPTLAADQPGFETTGGYWRGAVWSPTTTMVIRGLENYGFRELARTIALRHLELVAQVYGQTGTLWENYSPDTVEPGKPAKGDFVGWSGLGPIMYLLEYAVGLRPDARHNELVWILTAGGKRGCEHFRFNDHVASLRAEAESGTTSRFRVNVDSDGEFGLRLVSQSAEKTLQVLKGKQEFLFDASSKDTRP